MVNITSAISSLVPASWRGVPINCTDYTVTKAPLTKVHMGAFWAHAQPEPLGTAPLRITLEGFLVGNFALLERAALQAMIVAPGSGILTLPSYGIYYAACLSSTFHEDISDLIEVSMEFIEVKSPFGDTAAALMSGNIPASIGDAVANLQSSAVTSFANLF